MKEKKRHSISLNQFFSVFPLIICQLIRFFFGFSLKLKQYILINWKSFQISFVGKLKWIAKKKRGKKEEENKKNIETFEDILTSWEMSMDRVTE